MFALERRIGRRWVRCAVCGNRALLDRVRAGQPRPKDWRVAAVPLCMKDYLGTSDYANAGQPAA